MLTARKVVLAAAIALASFSPALPVSAAQLVALVAGDVGQGRPADCPSRWCACYLDKALTEAGLAPLGSYRAKDFAHYGGKARPGQVGAIMVMPHHVGVVAGACPDGRVKLLSGNHNHRVGMGCYKRAKAIAWRLPVRG